MGCSNSGSAKSIDDKVNTQSKEGTESQLCDLKDGMDIKIFSAMLVNENKEDVLKYYKPVQTIGKGSFGKVFKVIQIATKKTFAMKVVSRNANLNIEDKNFLREILILRKLDHPNIMKIYEYFVNDNFYYFIMEYVPGGELYDQITKMQNYDERLACLVTRQILSSISYLHQMNIVHRDLKPENMMLTNEKDMTIKLIDFGAANYVKPGEFLSLKIGSPYYIAPEVIEGKYGLECDLWSIGVILYILLVGYPPFEGDTNNEILQKISNGKYSLNGEGWNQISKQAKDLIQNLLVQDPKKRISALAALKHPWIQKLSEQDSSAKATSISLKSCLYNFDSKQKLHQASIAFIVHQMENNNMVKELTAIFKSMDESGEGLLSIQELKNGYHKFFKDNLTDEEFDQIMEMIDQDKSGQISIEEFLRATVDHSTLVSENNLKYAFDSFDRDHSGYLSPDEVREVLGINENNENTKKIIEEIIKEVDLNGDGQINFEEFKLMMTKGMK
ncbi:MAG: protein kinase [archaeon]|nr:protein kinase [archaeon]